MKPTTRFATAVAALAGLLFQATATATDLAELPLTAHLLAKPNVVVGLDDSGSMDMEVMLYSNDGVLWWNFDAGSGWGIDASHPNPAQRSVASPWFNGPGDATATWRVVGYLFPGVAEVGSRQMPDDVFQTFAALPSSQLAFLRWSGAWRDASGTYQATAPETAAVPPHNPLYYNPLVTYRPWAPAQLSNGAWTPANADPAAVLSHPITGKQTFDLSAATGIAPSPANNKVFTALPGMRIPGSGIAAGDVRKSVCDDLNAKCGPWTDVTADETAAAGAVTRVAMRYYPATYWVKEACTLPAVPRVGLDDCATAPDGSRLRRYEIRPGRTFPSGRSYAAELQNFANWFQYYRKRRLMLSAAMGETMKSLGGMRVGVVPYQERSGDVKMYDTDAAADTDNRRRVAGLFYEVADGRGTPTRETLKYIGDEYRRTQPSSGKGKGKDGPQPPIIQYACQRNNAFIVTDGYANASMVAVPPWDAGKSEATWGAGAPYATNGPSTLADLALRYYTNNPRPDLGTGAVALTAGDRNADLHVNTYGLTLGARGTLYLSESTTPPTSASAWPNPTVNHSPASVDDLWHATLNGRGRMYLATTVDETALRIRAGLDDMRNRAGAQSAVGISSVNLQGGDKQAYAASYNPAGWTGDLSASAVDPATGSIGSTPRWSAAKLLDARAFGTRVIVTSDGSARGGMAFTAATIGAKVNPAPGQMTDAGVVDYLRGSRVGEGSLYRPRTSLLGPVINAEPAVDAATGMVYVASGEGMLHAFNSSTGAEEWAYVPNAALAGIGQTALRDYIFKTQLDGTPVLGKGSAGATLLVAGMGAAGRSYYALDVSSPKSLTEAQAAQRVKWTFPSPAQAAEAANMGYSVGRPMVVKTAADGPVVLVTSGYDNGQSIGDGRGRLWMLNADTGAVIREFTTALPGGTGSSSESGLAQITGYREDDGTVRRVYGGDLQGRLWKFDLATGSTTLVATLKDKDGNPQPITTRPQLSTLNGAPVVMVGTGRLLDLTDFGSSAVQTVYAFTDSGPLPDLRAATMPLTLDGSTITGSVDWSASRGWRLDLPAGQHVNVDPKFVLGWLHVNANTAGSTSCAQSSQNYRIAVKAEGKAGAASVVGDSTLLSASANAMSPVVVQSGDAMFRWTRLNDGSVVNTPVPDVIPIPARKNAWRAVLR
jgi:type IV pilus assembly protein PilY1